MFEVIKGSNPFTNIIIEGEAVINNRIIGETAEEEPKDDENVEEPGAEEEESEGTEKKQEPPKINYAELEDLKEQYRREGQEYAVAMHKRADAELEKAREEAEKIVEEAKEKGRRLLKQIDEKSEATFDEARKRGLDEGFDEGHKKGEEEGYLQGLKKCKEALMELKQLCEKVEHEKAEIMAENRRGIFDLAMGVAEKITMTVFSQKDKKALEKMITAAAKEFRNAKNIRVTLSKHDVSENMEADFQIYEKCFAPTANVEFEVVDADSGTLMLENDTEIFDAGVSTQLKMIGELGRGKFREKEEDPRELEETVSEAVYAQAQPKPEPKPVPETKPEAKAETKPAKAARAPRASRAAKAAAAEPASAPVPAEVPVSTPTPAAVAVDASASVPDADAKNAGETAAAEETVPEIVNEAARETVNAVVTENAAESVIGTASETSAAGEGAIGADNDSDDSDDAFEFVSEGMAGDVFSE